MALQQRSINRRCWLLLLLCIKTLEPAASTFDFNTVGIKEIVGQGGKNMHRDRI